MYFVSCALKVVEPFEEMCPNESCEACNKSLIRICCMTIAEKVLLKLITFLCKLPMASMK